MRTQSSARRPRTRRPPPRPTRSGRRNPPLTSTRPVTVAITGGIGAGKSETLRAFARHGAATSSSDEIVHGLLRADDEVHDALRERWGEAVLGPDGADRAAIAEIVFADALELEWLERLLHPKVVREYLAWRERLASQPDPPKLAVTEVPLLFETGGEQRFDHVVTITAPQDVRAARSAVRADARDQRLLPDEEKVRRADFAFVNDGSLEELDAFVADLVARLT